MTDDADHILEAYRRREAASDASRYSLSRAGNRYAREERGRVLLRALHDRGSLLAEMSVLEVGCGTGSELTWLTHLGADPGRLHGIDLRSGAVDEAKRRNPLAEVVVGDAANLPFDNASFELVYQSTALSSMTSRAMRTRVAAEMQRVTRAGGLIVSYDFIWNPFNRDTTGIPSRELHRLFSGLPIEIHTVTLAPPLGRWLGDHSVRMLNWAARVPALRTHRLAIIDVPA